MSLDGTESGLYQAAQNYTESGIIVHPLYRGDEKSHRVNSPGKQPILKKWQTLNTPFDDANLQYYFKEKKYNIGAVCGKISDLTVIDVDWEVKGIWVDIFSGVDTTGWIKQQRTEGKHHYLFRYTNKINRAIRQELGFDIMNDRSNVVLAPSMHSEGQKYEMIGDIADRPEMPDIVADRIIGKLQLYDDLSKSLIKCRHTFRGLWDAVFKDKKHSYYHKTSIFRTADGRDRTLALFAELKRNGATYEELRLVCQLIFGDQYDEELSRYQISQIDPERTAKTETIKADTILNEFFDPSRAKEESKTIAKNKGKKTWENKDQENEKNEYSQEILKNVQVPGNPREKLQTVKRFIEDHLMSLTKSEAEEIIITDLTEHFHLTRDEIQNIKRFYKETAVNRKDRYAELSKNWASDLEIDEEFEGLYTLKWNSEKTKVTEILLHFDKIAMKVLDNLCTISYKGQIYVYQGGYYDSLEEIAMKEITRIINGIRKGRFSSGIKSYSANVLHNILYFNPAIEYPFNKENAAIPVKNGVILLDFENKTRRLIPHSPEYKFNYIIPTEYNENADPKPIDDILKQYSPDQVDELYQLPAQAIMQMLGYGPFKKCYLLQGNRDAGKSSYIELLIRAFGANNRCDVSLDMLNPKENKFALSSLEGKIFNVHDDMTYFSLKDTGTIKDLTGSYAKEIEKKGKQRYGADIRAVHCFACNKPPKYDGEIKKDVAFWERWVYIYFPNRFDKVLTFYDDNFTPNNLSGFLNRVLDYVLEMGHDKKLVCNYSYADVRSKWAKCADPVYRFVSENMEKISKTEKPMYYKKEDFLDLIKTWAKDQGEDEDEEIPATVTMLSKNISICEIDQDARIIEEKTGSTVRVFGIPYKWKIDSSYKDVINRVLPLKVQAKINN